MTSVQPDTPEPAPGKPLYGPVSAERPESELRGTEATRGPQNDAQRLHAGGDPDMCPGCRQLPARDVPAILCPGPQETTVKHTDEIDIYPVGLLAHWQEFIHNPDRAWARRKLRYALHYLLSQARDRNWRAVRNYFNGYLAEHPTHGTRAGHGWTKGRAYRDLVRHLHSDPRHSA